MVDKVVNSRVEQDEELALLVRFKLHVYFASMQFAKRSEDTTAKSREKFANFLMEEGPNYSQFPQLAPYFALPYIVNNPNHLLLVEIRKV